MFCSYLIYLVAADINAAFINSRRIGAGFPTADTYSDKIFVSHPPLNL